MVGRCLDDNGDRGTHRQDVCVPCIADEPADVSRARMKHLRAHGREGQSEEACRQRRPVGRGDKRRDEAARDANPCDP